MKRKRHTEEHIIAILKKAEAGQPVPGVGAGKAEGRAFMGTRDWNPSPRWFTH